MGNNLPDKKSSKDQVANYVWNNYSFFGKSTKMDQHSTLSTKSKKALSENDLDKGILPITFYKLKNTKGEFISDGGSTLKYLVKSCNATKKELLETMGRIYGSASVCKIGDELAVKIDKNCSADQARKKLNDFILRAIAVCNSIVKSK